MNSLLRYLLVCGIAAPTLAQTAGPNNAGTGVNNSGTGSIAWTNPGNITASDDVYATVTNGTSQLLRASQFGFSLPLAATVLGIEMSIEKRGRAQNNVGAGAWAYRQAPAFVTGQPASTYTSTTYAYTAVAGSNRLLLVGIAIENVDNIGNDPALSITSVTYGGQALTPVAVQSTASASTRNLVAFYYLNENLLSAAVGTNLIVNKTRSATSAGNDNEYVEYLAINVFTQVNQLFPIDFAGSSNTGTTVGAGPLAVRRGDYLVSITNGNTPGISYTASAGNTLVSNTTVNNILTTGITFQLQTRPSIAANTTVTPTAVGSATTQRLNMIGIVIRGGRVFDNLTQLHQNGTPLGSDLSLGNSVIGRAWPDDDAFTAYGGPSTLWGRTWTATEINNTGFGLDIQADAAFAVASVDAVQARVTFTLPLPVSGTMVQALCSQSGFSAQLEAVSPSTEVWLERSSDGFYFTPVKKWIPQAHSRSGALSDATPGRWYYRIQERNEQAPVQIGSINYCAIVTSANVAMFPNPAHDFLWIEAPSTLHTVSLLSEQGKVLVQVPVHDAHHCTVSLREHALSSGNYYVHVVSERGSSTHKVVIR